jgi:hypothetical protein
MLYSLHFLIIQHFCTKLFPVYKTWRIIAPYYKPSFLRMNACIFLVLITSTISSEFLAVKGKKISFPLLYLKPCQTIIYYMVPTNLHLAEVRFTFTFLRVHVKFLLVESKYLHKLEGGPPLLLDVTNFNTFLF